MPSTRSTHLSPLPPLKVAPIPSLTSLTTARASPLLRWQLLELLYAYCFIMRLYNGDPSPAPHEAAGVAMALADVLLQVWL